MTTPTKTGDNARHPDVVSPLYRELSDQYGPLVGGRDLCRLLGFSTATAFRQAWRRAQLPVPVFAIPHRRGGYALTLDIATWLGALRNESLSGRRRP